MKKTILSAIIFLFVAGLASADLFADDTSSLELEATNAKIERVLTTQQEILKELADIKAEMQILKIRVSNN